MKERSLLPPVQKKIFQFIQEEISTFGAPPTLRSIQKAFQFKAIGTVQDHIRALIAKGFLEKSPQKARGIRPSARFRSQAIGIPILGSVPAGPPTENIENVIGTLPVPPDILQNDTCFALRVKGDSMINAGILDGDFVIARSQSTAENGDIVIALVDGESTVKRLEKTENSVRLLPENPAYLPIELRYETSTIQGKVLGVTRWLG